MCIIRFAAHCVVSNDTDFIPGLLDRPTGLHPTLYSPALPTTVSTTAAAIKHFAFRVRTGAARTSAATANARVRYVRGAVWTLYPPSSVDLARGNIQ